MRGQPQDHAEGTAGRQSQGGREYPRTGIIGQEDVSASVGPFRFSHRPGNVVPLKLLLEFGAVGTDKLDQRLPRDLGLRLKPASGHQPLNLGGHLLRDLDHERFHNPHATTTAAFRHFFFPCRRS